MEEQLPLWFEDNRCSKIVSFHQPWLPSVDLTDKCCNVIGILLLLSLSFFPMSRKIFKRKSFLPLIFFLVNTNNRIFFFIFCLQPFWRDSIDKTSLEADIHIGSQDILESWDYINFSRSSDPTLLSFMSETWGSDKKYNLPKVRASLGQSQGINPVKV